MKQDKQTQMPKKVKNKRRRKALRIMLILFCLGLAAYAGLVGYVYYMETHVPEPSDYDSIIVLGAEVKENGEPSVQLQWRLDKALEMYNLREVPIVACGAQGPKEPRPEGEVMRDVLIAGGVAVDKVYAEITSFNTAQNLANAKEILDDIGCHKPLIVTSDYHLPRALAIAEDVGLEAQGVGAPCRPGIGFWLKNHMREALAWGKYWGIKYVGLPL